MITSLVNSTEHWCHNADNQKLNMTIFLDLNKAFDTVDHITLIDKLMKDGIKGIECLTEEGIEYPVQKMKVAAARVRVIISGVYREEKALRTEMKETPLRKFGHVWRPPSNTPDQRAMNI